VRLASAAVRGSWHINNSVAAGDELVEPRPDQALQTVPIAQGPAFHYRSFAFFSAPPRLRDE
jgi:hypothetical protein